MCNLNLIQTLRNRTILSCVSERERLKSNSQGNIKNVDDLSIHDARATNVAHGTLDLKLILT